MRAALSDPSRRRACSVAKRDVAVGKAGWAHMYLMHRSVVPLGAIPVAAGAIARGLLPNRADSTAPGSFIRADKCSAPLLVYWPHPRCQQGPLTRRSRPMAAATSALALARQPFLRQGPPPGRNIHCHDAPDRPRVRGVSSGATKRAGSGQRKHSMLIFPPRPTPSGSLRPRPPRAWLSARPGIRQRGARHTAAWEAG
jgi:hypothetical protein